MVCGCASVTMSVVSREVESSSGSLELFALFRRDDLGILNISAETLRFVLAPLCLA
jgi:hypothetical protein